MSALPLLVTNAGLARFTAAQLGDDIDLAVTHVQLTDTAFIAAPTLDALPGAFRRIETISGKPVGDGIVHMVVRDEAAIGYGVRGLGLFLADGTLFALYGQAERIAEKAVATTLHLALDIAFPTGSVANLIFGDTDFLNPPATTDTAGVVELATEAEAVAGTDMRRTAPVAAMWAAIRAALNARLGTGPTDWSRGFLKQATPAEGRGQLELGSAATQNNDFFVTAAGYTPGSVLERINLLGVEEFLRIVDSVEAPEGRYRLWSDGLKECWGVTDIPANSTVGISLPIGSNEYIVPTGQPIFAGTAPAKVFIRELIGPPFIGFSVTNTEAVAVKFYWHSKGR